MFKQLSDVLGYVGISLQNGTTSDVLTTGIKTSKFYPYYPGLRAQIDISKNVEETALKGIQLGFKKPENYSIDIELDDGAWDTVRPIYNKRMRQRGTKIILEKGKSSILKEYYTTIRQIVHEEDDKTINCKNYPNEEFDTYKDCDMAMTRKTVYVSLK